MSRAFIKILSESLNKIQASIMPYYAVRQGRQTGIYNTWSECKDQVHGVAARFKKFQTMEEAQEFMNAKDTGDTNQRRKFYAKQPSPRKNYKTWNKSFENQCSPSTPDSNPSSSYDFNDGNKLSGKQFYGGKRKAEYGESSTKRLKADDTGRAVVYSDGCCIGNGRHKAKAGIGVYWGEGDPRNTSERLTGNQTNQRAELNAAIKAVETAVKQKIPKIEIRTDSTYTMNAVTKWMNAWERNGFKTANGTDVKNKDDIVKLHKLCKSVDVKWTHVRGHVGVLGNERADILAKQGANQ